MTPTYTRWRIERLAELLQTQDRREALCTVAAEEIDKPWERDPRPAPHPLVQGYIHT